MDKRQTVSSNNEGQALVVAILIASTFAGLILGWGYLQNMQQGGSGLRDAAVLNRIANSVATRITQVLPLTATTADCNATMIKDFAPFQNFSTPVTGSVQLCYPAAVGTCPAAPEIANCLLKVAAPNFEFGTASPLATLQISLQQVGAPDQNGLFSTVNISVLATSQRGIGNAKGAHSVNVTSQVILAVQSLSAYNLILTKGGVFSAAVPRINVPATSSLEIKGSVLYADTTSPLDLTTVVGSSPITFDSNFDIQGSSFYYANSASVCPAGTTCPLDLSLMAKTFKGGLNTNVMALANTLPIYDTGPPGEAAYTWHELIDYNAGAYPLSGTSAFPMPAIAGAEVPAGSAMWGSQITPGTGDAGIPGVGAPPGPPAPNSYSALDVVYPGTGPNLSPATMGGAGLVVPSGGTTGILSLEQTCFPEAAHATPPANEFVFLDTAKNFGIDFTGTTYGGKPGGIFCGLIAANDLYIYAPAAGGPFYVFGLIIANSVHILGTGSVIFANPMDNSPLSGAGPFAGTNAATQTQAGIAADMSYLATSYGHNFFVPVFQADPTTLPASLDTYRPHGALRTNFCCADPSTGTNINDTIGYVCSCYNDSGTACPQVAPPADSNYCIAVSGKPTSQQNMWYLFNAPGPPPAPATPGVLAPLLFSVKVVQ